ncbi:MAG: polysaccharide pyruvyl transferase family protein [Mycetocola sp.]
MRALVLWADDRSANLGVRALAAGTERLLQAAAPGIDVTFHNFGRPIPQLPVGRFTSLARERLTGRNGMQRWLGGFDVIVDTRAGDSFADLYGLRRLTMMSAIAECAAQAGTPVILGPQTIGPFTTRRGRLLARHSLRRARLVMARDSASAAYAAQLGHPVDILATDVVFALPQPVVERSRDVILNVSGLLWNGNPHVDSSGYRRTIADLVARLRADGREISLLAHVIDSPSPDNDVPAIREFASRHLPDAEIIIPTDLADVREVVATGQVVVASRMHACLNALSVGTPAVPLAYSRKFGPLLGDLGWNETVELTRAGDDAARTVVERMSGTDLAERADRVRTSAATLLAPATTALAASLS